MIQKKKKKKNHMPKHENVKERRVSGMGILRQDCSKGRVKVKGK